MWTILKTFKACIAIFIEIKVWKSGIIEGTTRLSNATIRYGKTWRFTYHRLF